MNKTLQEQKQLLMQEFKNWYQYDSKLSREVNLTLQEKRKKDMKKKISDLIEKTKKEDSKKKANEPTKPTGNVYEQMKDIKKAQSLYIK